MNKLLIISFLLVLIQSGEYNSYGNDERGNEIEKVVTTLFDMMRDSDGERIKELITEGATLHTVIQENGNTSLRETRFDDFIRSVSATEPGTLDEQLTSFISHEDENLATAWMEYRFFVSGEFSHCGVNTMNLVKKPDGWKIFSIVDTRKTEGC